MRAWQRVDDGEDARVWRVSGESSNLHCRGLGIQAIARVNLGKVEQCWQLVNNSVKAQAIELQLVQSQPDKLLCCLPMSPA